MLLTAKSAKEYKQELFEKQGGICPLCQLPLFEDMSKNHLDHDHDLDGKGQGRVRGLLHSCCNRLEGSLTGDFKRFGVGALGADFVVWATNYVNYIKGDYTNNHLHPQYAVDKVKRFSRLTRAEMVAIMDAEGFDYCDADTREEITKKYMKQFIQRLR